MLSSELDDASEDCDEQDKIKIRLNDLRRVKNKAIRRQNQNQNPQNKRQLDVINMLKTESLYKESLSTFHRLPAIGKQNIHDQLQINRPDHEWENFATNSKNLNNSSSKLAGLSFSHGELSRDSGKLLNKIHIKNRLVKTSEYDGRNDIAEKLKERKSTKFTRQTTYDVPDPLAITLNVKNKQFRHQAEMNDHTKYIKQDISGNKTDINQNNIIQRIDPALFKKSKKLLERRQRDSPGELTVSKKETPKRRTVNIQRNIKALNDPPSSDSDCDDGQPKMSNLIEMFNSLQVSRRYKERLRKTNNWF